MGGAVTVLRCFVLGREAAAHGDVVVLAARAVVGTRVDFPRIPTSIKGQYPCDWEQRRYRSRAAKMGNS